MLIFGTLPGICFAGGMTSFLLRAEDPDFRLPEVRRAVPEPDSGERGKDGGRSRNRDRVHPQAELPEGGPGERDPGQAEASRRGWCASSRPWSPARPTSHGTTNRPARHIWCRMTASACITTSISWTRNWACATCVCRRGCRAGCRSTSTVITGWRASWASWASTIEWPTTPSLTSRTGNGRSASPTAGKRNASTNG